MEAEDLLDKFAQDEGFGNWDTVVLNCHHSVIRSVAIAAVNEALRQPHVTKTEIENEIKSCLKTSIETDYTLDNDCNEIPFTKLDIEWATKLIIEKVISKYISIPVCNHPQYDIIGCPFNNQECEKCPYFPSPSPHTTT